MSPKIKRILFRSIGIILLVALFIWYFFPVFAAKWFNWNCAELKQYMAVTPTRINTLPSFPDEWISLSIGDLKLKLPLSKYKKFGGNEMYLYLCSDSGSMVITDIVPAKQVLDTVKECDLNYPLISYGQRLDILSSSPSDISFFNSRAKNKSAAAYQILKAISLPGGVGKIFDVHTKSLKALCIVSDTLEKGISATIDVYNKNETVCFSILLKEYTDTVSLEADLLWLLGGIEMPDHLLDRDQAKKDIATIVSKWKKT